MNEARTESQLPELANGRVHEISGAAALAFGLVSAHRGTVLICGSPAQVASIHPEGAAHFIDPRQIITVPCPLRADALWTAETALRSGSVDCVMAILGRTPGLTELRRLQLAAQDGKALGLLLTEQPAANSAAETRWYCQPALSKTPDSTLLRLSLYKNKRGTMGHWILDVKGDKDTLDLHATPVREPDGTGWHARR
ncbi:ImuA family protein [Aquisalinus flavus]|uniref:Protein ImuA n=1 Tax=Aquisalinus flavus TaxID=1526572 RepID=A0A8J2V6B9_9PROT|nr:hypothetical protein [Aquisalinus flavus]MBD0426047.1 hypothetical protein [Aquisalinus flavus]UNE48362.1 hypothetical protein FF099_10040 [Aquisalinus flavus]GGD11145.1 hypothetical protein GCM10011342_19930 [Aquisalinus flavus]